MFSCRSSVPRAGDPPAAQPAASNSRAAAASEGELVVFAASSLREAFSELGAAFERSHAGVEVTLNFAGTQELRTQLEHGAAADIFASADQQQMAELVHEQRVTEPTIFARNEPVMVVAVEQRARLRTFADLANTQHLVIGTPEVPIGRYTLQILDNASRKLGADFRRRVEAAVVSRELNVKQVLAKVTLGEADAAIVYRSDVTAATSKLGVVTIPADLNVIAQYPLAIVRGAPHAHLAADWVAFVLSSAGRTALEHAGFLAPSE